MREASAVGDLSVVWAMPESSCRKEHKNTIDLQIEAGRDWQAKARSKQRLVQKILLNSQ